MRLLLQALALFFLVGHVIASRFPRQLIPIRVAFIWNNYDCQPTRIIIKTDQTSTEYPLATHQTRFVLNLKDDVIKSAIDSVAVVWKEKSSEWTIESGMFKVRRTQDIYAPDYTVTLDPPYGLEE